MYRHEQDFDRSFKRVRRLVTAVTILVFVGIFGVMSVMGFVAYKAVGIASDPSSIGNYVGEVVNGYNKSANK